MLLRQKYLKSYFILEKRLVQKVIKVALTIHADFAELLQAFAQRDKKFVEPKSK